MREKLTQETKTEFDFFRTQSRRIFVHSSVFLYFKIFGHRMSKYLTIVESCGSFTNSKHTVVCAWLIKFLKHLHYMENKTSDFPIFPEDSKNFDPETLERGLEGKTLR